MILVFNTIAIILLMIVGIAGESVTTRGNSVGAAVDWRDAAHGGQQASLNYFLFLLI